MKQSLKKVEKFIEVFKKIWKVLTTPVIKKD